MYLLGIFTFYKYQDPQSTLHCCEGGRVRDDAITSVDTIATGIHSSEHEADWFVFFLLMMFYADPGVWWFTERCIVSVWFACKVVNHFVIFKKFKSHVFSFKLWARHGHIAIDRYTVYIQLVWREKCDKDSGCNCIRICNYRCLLHTQYNVIFSD